MHLPDYIDNDLHKLEDVLRTLILHHSERELDIVTGYLHVEVWSRLQEGFNQLNGLRLLIGREPSVRPAEIDRIDLRTYYRRNIQEQLDQQDFNRDYKELIENLINFLKQDHVQVRLYGGAEGASAKFLHAKAYIFDHNSIIGSSNLTPSGLSDNTELNILIKQESISRDLRQNWFQKFWNDPEVDQDYKSKLLDVLESSKFGSKQYTPYQVFIKALFELFREDIQNNGDGRTVLDLASFQQEGFERAVRLLDRHQAVMIADAVGLGKTFIGLRLIEHYLVKDREPGRVPRALVICPAQLRDLIWSKKLDEFGLKANIVSQEELGRITFDVGAYKNHDIIVIDESHNFRNSGTNRYQNLQKLLGAGKRGKRIVLLTATPINNSIYDLYHQILLMTRNIESYYRTWGIYNLNSYFKALAKGNADITELLLQTMVRRSRQDVIKRQESGEEIRINGKEIRFPKRQLEKFTYNFEDSFQGLYAEIGMQIDQLNLAPYNVKAFKRRQSKDEKSQVKRNQALVALMKSLWLKRLESSIAAFEASIQTQRNFQVEFSACIDDGKVLSSKIFRKIIAAETDPESSIAINELLDSLEEISIADYDIHQLKQQISDDFNSLEDILNKLRRIQDSVAQGKDYDRKLMAFKNLTKADLAGHKILVFSYFKETALYLHRELLQDQEWLKAMAVVDEQGTRPPRIDVLTGATPGLQRWEKVRRFAPNANCEGEEQYQDAQENPIDILICTDVLSEGQNLQDAGILINYDLHWNPVRMIQRAGRIDRIGTPYDLLYIYNCFPEEGLENLINLVKRLQDRIATIDSEVGLDGSVLGEEISDRSIDELIRLNQADSEAEKTAILNDLEQSVEFISADQMRFPLLDFLAQSGQEMIEDIPMGIHSTRTDGIEGVFLAFRAKDRHFWHFYPRINGKISTDNNSAIKEKRKIFKMIECTYNDYPNNLMPVVFDYSIFPILEDAINNVLEELKQVQTRSRIPRRMNRLISTIYTALTDQDWINSLNDTRMDSLDKVTSILMNEELRAYDKEIRGIWNNFKEHDNRLVLVDTLDEFFVEQEIGRDLLTEPEEDQPEASILYEDIQLVCYEWFKPQ